MSNSSGFGENPFTDLETTASPQADGTRSKAFDEEMARFGSRYDELLMDESLSTAEYLKRREELEKEEAKRLEEILKADQDPANPEFGKLNLNQKDEISARVQNHKYREENRELEAAYERGDEGAKEKYLERHNQFKALREEIYKDPEFGQNEHIKNIQAKEAELQQAIDTDDHAKRHQLQQEMATEWRSFNQEMRNDPDGREKMRQFVEKHQDNQVLKDSGAVNFVKSQREKDRQLSRTQEPEKEAEQNAAAEVGGEVTTPKGRPIAGATVTVVTADGKEVILTAQGQQVGADGKPIDLNQEMFAQDRDGNAVAAETIVTATIKDKDGMLIGDATYKADATGKLQFQDFKTADPMSPTTSPLVKDGTISQSQGI